MRVIDKDFFGVKAADVFRLLHEFGLDEVPEELPAVAPKDEGKL